MALASVDQNPLSEDDLKHYQQRGYLHLESFVDEEILGGLQRAAAEFVELSRDLESSNRVLDLEPSHTAESPRIRRLNSPVDHHDAFRAFALEGPGAALACAVLGGPVRYHHSKLNFKWSGGGEEIKWHQDIQFWPHTDFTPLTIGVYLADVDELMGPMGVLPGSHQGPLYNQYLDSGEWGGAMNPQDVAEIDLSKMEWLTGPAGSVTVHNCCMIHGSVPNNSSSPRPLLLQTYSAVNSYPIAHIGANGVTGHLSGTVIGGTSDQRITVEGRQILGAPDWSRAGAPTIFGSQQEAE